MNTSSFRPTIIIAVSLAVAGGMALHRDGGS